ncbi:MAG: phosphate signaling complex protein PhoU [Chitinivibrionales bacterium]|nr:phosphate signaling complex protein PhoU [Chitinivibrionales bacterium]
MQTYLEESLQRDIDRIRTHVEEMAHIAQKALSDCVEAIIQNDRQRVYAVILRDQFINEKEKEIDRLCLEFLVRQQPVAKHLRFAYSTIRINLELERIGDYAESIARNLLQMTEWPADVDIKENIVEMAKVAIIMFNDSIQAFVKEDVHIANSCLGIGETVDTMRNKLNKSIVHSIEDKKISSQLLEPLLAIVRRIERVADQARNICLEVLYMCTGEYSKHPGTQAFRVLFLDKHNSCRSQIAEAIANSQNKPKFIFTSAGMEPRIIDGKTLSFMKAKGYDLSRVVPRSLMQVPNLNYYHVIVKLAKDACHPLPPMNPKTITIEWFVDDPSEVQGSADIIQSAYEKAFEFLKSHCVELIEAIEDIQPYTKGTSNENKGK